MPQGQLLALRQSWTAFGRKPEIFKRKEATTVAVYGLPFEISAGEAESAEISRWVVDGQVLNHHVDGIWW